MTARLIGVVDRPAYRIEVRQGVLLSKSDPDAEGTRIYLTKTNANSAIGMRSIGLTRCDVVELIALLLQVTHSDQT